MNSDAKTVIYPTNREFLTGLTPINQKSRIRHRYPPKGSSFRVPKTDKIFGKLARRLLASFALSGLPRPVLSRLQASPPILLA
jgi:hypothetical protein